VVFCAEEKESELPPVEVAQVEGGVDAQLFRQLVIHHDVVFVGPVAEAAAFAVLPSPDALVEFAMRDEEPEFRIPLEEPDLAPASAPPLVEPFVEASGDCLQRSIAREAQERHVVLGIVELEGAHLGKRQLHVARADGVRRSVPDAKHRFEHRRFIGQRNVKSPGVVKQVVRRGPVRGFLRDEKRVEERVRRIGTGTGEYVAQRGKAAVLGHSFEVKAPCGQIRREGFQKALHCRPTEGFQERGPGDRECAERSHVVFLCSSIEPSRHSLRLPAPAGPRPVTPRPRRQPLRASWIHSGVRRFGLRNIHMFTR
jgi:hypothetical protein